MFLCRDARLSVITIALLWTILLASFNSVTSYHIYFRPIRTRKLHDHSQNILSRLCVMRHSLRAVVDELHDGTSDAANNNIRIPVKDFIRNKLEDTIASSNATAMLLSLISIGDRWSKTKPKFNHATIPQHWSKVTGCMADVRIGVTITHRSSDQVSIKSHGRDSAESISISLDGTADSRVALGMLALVCEVKMTSELTV